jgi:acyl-CoA thioester hydrolase
MALDGAGVEVWVGGANTWECDRLGHLNVRFHVTKAMEALSGLVAVLGMPHAFQPKAAATVQLREHHIRFLKEVHPGACLSATGGVISMDETEARVLIVLRHPAGEPASAFQMTIAHVTAEGAPFPWPARVRETAQALKVAIPAYAVARSITDEPVALTASLARAEQMGLRRLALGMIGPNECDAFGRMRAEAFMSRISDGVGRLFAGEPPRVTDLPPERVGGAALEYRLIYAAFPRMGERIELRSGFAGVGDRFRTLVHWLLDPDSDRVWGAAAAVAATFDLHTRKLIINSEASQASMRERLTPGLTF